MESEGMNLLINSTVLIAVFAGACVLLLMYIIKLLNADQKSVDHKPKTQGVQEPQPDKRKESAALSKSKKKNPEGRWTGRAEKQSYSHPWLRTSLKGHTSQVLDMDYSSNGKYLASCGEEEPDPGDDPGVDAGNSSSSNSDTNHDSSQPSSANPSPRTQGLSRRQRKNRRREDLSPPEQKKKPKPKRPEAASPRKSVASVQPRYVVPPPPLRISLKLDLEEQDVARYLGSFLLSYEQMLTFGYPVSSDTHEGRTIVFKSHASAAVYQSGRSTKINISESKFDVNAQEFIPGMDYSEIKAEWNANHDSGQGSGSSSDSGEAVDDSESSSCTDCDAIDKNDVYGSKSASQYDQHKCVRCSKNFLITKDYKYVTEDRCVYHWGKLHYVYPDGRQKHSGGTQYTCCNGNADSKGCTTCKVHVWNGVEPGFNGPYDDYVYTYPRRTPPQGGNYGVYAVDCEMCYTAAGMELTKVTVVGVDGRLVYDELVRPERQIVDYNTRFSGITAKDMSRAVKQLRDVQNDLMGFINEGTILIGHGLESDLRALRIMHPTVVDTTVAFPHTYGLPYKRSLKNLTYSILKREIQCGTNGHDSYEDALAAMELMLWRVRKDFRPIFHISQ